MDELMAAMVLSSLSCSPLLHSPAHQDTTGTTIHDDNNNNTQQHYTKIIIINNNNNTKLQ